MSTNEYILNSSHVMHVSAHACLCFVLQPMLQLCMQQSLSFASGNDSSFGQLQYVQSTPPLAESVCPSLSAHTHLRSLDLAP